MTAAKLDIVREDRDYYRAGAKPELLEFGKNSYLTLQGQSRPGGKAFQDSIEFLFRLCYRLKFYYKEKGRDFSVPRLECLWWSVSGKPFYQVKMSEWVWKLMIRMPEFVTPSSVERSKEALAKEKGVKRAAEPKLEHLRIGKCVQMMHVGPYESERETACVIAEFISKHGLSYNGPFHELYLSDPRRTAQEELKTIIRQPVR